ncbi:MAG: hypothetical protein WD648_08305 [Planctomycetaceae bacterium]
MTKRVLDVGQCNPDHSSISQFLRKHFDVEIARAALPADALGQLRDGRFDLVLINRKLDADYSDGTEILRAIKADESLCGIPVMLVSNYADAQQAAVIAGAEYGFGKAELGSPHTLERLAKFLK